MPSDFYVFLDFLLFLFAKIRLLFSWCGGKVIFRAKTNQTRHVSLIYITILGTPPHLLRLFCCTSEVIAIGQSFREFLDCSFNHKKCLRPLLHLKCLIWTSSDASLPAVDLSRAELNSKSKAEIISTKWIVIAWSGREIIVKPFSHNVWPECTVTDTSASFFNGINYKQVRHKWIQKLSIETVERRTTKKNGFVKITRIVSRRIIVVAELKVA